MAQIGETKIYTANPVPAVATAYAWTISGGGTINGVTTGSTLSVTWTSAGTHTVNVTASNTCSSQPASTTETVTSCTALTGCTITG
jgi:PKD repeat protein